MAPSPDPKTDMHPCCGPKGSLMRLAGGAGGGGGGGDGGGGGSLTIRGERESSAPLISADGCHYRG